MAKTPAQTVMARTETTDAWVAQTLQLIQAASDYASTGSEDPEMSATIRQLKVVTAAFAAALNTIR